MATGPDSYRWSLEVVSIRVRSQLLKPLDEYHPRVLDALLNHLPDHLKREAIRRAQEADDLWEADLEETGDPEWDEMNRALRAGVDPSTLPSWGGGDNE
jgi:hypothetical protein